MIIALGIASCGARSASNSEASSSTEAAPQLAVADFNADSAFAFVKRQCDFGARVPLTPAHAQCGDWIEAQLQRFCDKVVAQKAPVTTFDGKQLDATNYIGSISPDAKKRILLVAHWDCRPWADADPDENKRQQAVMGANDGASGVGVLLEVARQAGLSNPKMGIDIFLTDAEDYGAPDDFKGTHKESWWALGTQAWCRKPHVDGYRANYGILLDMVGAKGATFYREYYSDMYARDIVNRVWGVASNIGLGRFFINQAGAGVTDDHVFINKMTGIPTIDIIDTRQDSDNTFYPHWHTSGDTIDKIDRETLKAVGTLLLNLIY